VSRVSAWIGPTNSSPRQAQAYWKKEHEGLIKFSKSKPERRWTYDHLKEVAKLSYAATKLYIEINELRAKIPTRARPKRPSAAMAAYRAWVGYPELVTFLPSSGMS